MKHLSTRFTIVKRSSGGSAVDKASYMSREDLYNEYDGKWYHPDKSNEDLVHCEINLPENAPSTYIDRETLWSSVEMAEKAKNAQLCRLMKASLPNEWTYEVAEEVVRKYVHENFVSKGMCADWAIHDSVNALGQRNLHFHLMLTLRAIDENGKWMPKQRKVYILDENGNKIRKGKNYKCTTEKTTDWDDKKYGRIWRENLTNLINQTNEALHIETKWEHRSFKELGLNIEPTIHLGSKANALEKKGIHTERGDYNRKVIEMRGLLDFINTTSATIEAFKQKAVNVSNEVINMIKDVVKRHGRLQLPVYNGTYLRKVRNRELLQNPDNMMRFVEKREISDFKKLDEFKDNHEATYNGLIDEFDTGIDRQNLLYDKIEAWERFEPYRDIKKQSDSLKGLARLVFDKDNKAMLQEYPNAVKALRNVIPEGEPITPKQWRAEIDKLVARRGEIEKALGVEVSELAYAETLKYNEWNEAREKATEVKAKEPKHERQSTRKHSYPER